jgi:hypothetical protein
MASPQDVVIVTGSSGFIGRALVAAPPTTMRSSGSTGRRAQSRHLSKSQKTSADGVLTRLEKPKPRPVWKS